jgi:glycosyltransferase involved in cell wall biosynthesis
MQSAGKAVQVTVIATVYNEARAIARLLDSLAGQTRRPDEVVICDGGSTDGTVELIRAWAVQQQAALPHVRVIVAPGANISRGRNLAIDAAAGPVIAVTDAGVRLENGWLEALVCPFEATGAHAPGPDAVAGFFVADAAGVFQTAMAATVLPMADEIDPARFLPSSRSVAFTKEAWAVAGGYPEWLDYCEDLVFDFRINALHPGQSTGFVWAPEARVHFRPRESLSSFWTQYYRYARGDGKADLWRKRHAARYVTYGVLLPALLGHTLFGFFAKWLGWVGLAAGIAVYCGRPWQRLARLGRDLTPRERLAAALLVPVIRVVGDVAKMVGYPVGLWWRRRNRTRPELEWRERLGQPRGVSDRRP